MMTGIAPSSMRPLQIAPPMPFAPPETKMTLSCSCKSMVALIQLKSCKILGHFLQKERLFHPLKVGRQTIR